MDVFYFLKERTELIRHFYDAASAPMLEVKRSIEAGEAPFDNPPYDDSGEPAYLSEWLRADVELELVGRAAVSMVSEALKQFFVNWERRMLAGDRPCQKKAPREFAGGFLAGYVACFGEAFALDWATCPARLDIVEQVVLARNLSQHGDLVLDHIEHDEKTRSKYQRPFFMRPDELTFDDNNPNSFISPSLHIARTSLLEAITQVEQLCAWIQERIEAWSFGQPTAP
jgi:hypothetical protein